MKIRKCRKVIVFEATEIVDLDPNDFKKLDDNPYNGKTDKEFLEYIKELVTYGGIPQDLNIDAEFALEKLDQLAEWEMYSSSLEKGEDSWLECGKENEKFRKNGGFEVEHSTDE
jgi:hypothetical protein